MYKKNIIVEQSTVSNNYAIVDNISNSGHFHNDLIVMRLLIMSEIAYKCYGSGMRLARLVPT